MTNTSGIPARNFLVLFLSQGFGKVVGLVFGFAAARLLGSAGFGNYAMLSALLSYFMVLTEFGLSPLLVREMSGKPHERRRLLFSGLMLRMTLALISFVLLCAIGWNLHWPALFLRCLLVGGAGTLLYAWNSTMTDFLTSADKLRFAAALDAICQGLFLAIVLPLLWSTHNILAIFVALLTANLARGIVLGFLVRREIGAFRLSDIDVAHCWGMSRDVLTFALLALLGTVYFKIDVLILYAYHPGSAVGWYEGAYRFLEALMVLNVSMMVALFPSLSRMGADANRLPELKETTVRALRFLIFSGLGCALLVSAIAKPLTRFCYGAYFAPSSGLVPVLMLALLLIHLNAPFGRILYVLGKQKMVLKFSLLTVSANIVLNFLLIPRWGAYGAAWTTVLSEIIGFAIFYPLVRSFLGPLPWKTVLRDLDQTDFDMLRKAIARRDA